MNKLDNSNFKVSVSSCLIAKNSGNKTIDNNLKIIKSIIKLQNKFLDNTSSVDIESNIKSFNLLPENLININNILDVIRSRN